ncbi:DUF3857 domain-containing protein [Psychroserpens sp. S379A]|uniref:DUF3857 domain-containing protein n=1 Tax=Psychroserpens sp. S379A TaxID=3415137 RepID=UPI003C7CF04D
MNSKLFLSLFCLCSITTLFAQPFYQDYDWDKNPSYSNEGFSEKSMASVKEKVVTEFYFNDEGGLVEYFLEHNVYYLNSDDAIENYNKIYLPHSSDSNLEVTKARVILKDGNIYDLDDSKILTATNEETNKTYKYFAFEGIEKGSYIEYLYVVKRYPSYKGKRLNFQSSFQKNNVEFDLFAPTNLIFKFKSYNELKEIENDTIIKDKNRWFFKIPKVKALERETLSAYNSHKKYLIYALDQNTASRTTDITSYSSVSQNIYDFYNKDISKKISSQLKKFLNNIDYNENDSDDQKIKAIESYIKTNIYLAEANSKKLSALEDILKDKVANLRGIIQLYNAIFKQLDVKYEFVYTCERNYMLFDKNFEANNFLTDVLFYFPKSKAYMSPSETDSRFGFPPAFLTDNYGLFIKEVAIGDFKSAVGKIKYIKPVSADHTIDKMIIDVKFDSDDISNININLKRSMTGYYALYIHPYMDIIKPEDKDEVIESYAKTLDEDAIISSKKVNNEDPNLFGKKPLEFVLDFNSNTFVEKAGKKYLFNVGHLIGPQTELYQEKERTLPVESEFQRSYTRTIKVTIPEGYTIANLDDINISNAYLNSKNVKLMSFDSSYILKGNTLTIVADEHYRMNRVNTDIYEEYRAVINSAADFNKITLILEPK